MNAFVSRGLTRLDAAIAAARGPVEAGCLRAERAALLARLGRFDDARALLAEVRAQQGTEPQAAVAAWLCLAEGLVDQYSHYGAQARDRIRRAHALSVAARLRPLIALSAAWLAHLGYAYGDLTMMARHVAEALQEAAADHHAARARASMVVAAAYHWGGRLDLAQPWYNRARHHATEDGDEATVSALITNRAWIAANQARLAAILGEPSEVPDAAQLRQLMLAVDSSDSFDQHVGKTSMSSFAPMQRAQLLVLQGEYARALTDYQAQLPTALREGMAYMAPVFHADMAWCEWQLGRPAEALALAQQAEAGFGPDCEEEDRAAAHGRLAQVQRALGDTAAADAHAAQAAADLAATKAARIRMVTVTDEALKQVPGLG